MDIRNGFLRVLGISLAAAFILSSCSTAVTTVPPATLAASPSPLNQGGSSTQVPTNTPVPATMAAPTATNAPTPTATTIEATTPTVVVTEAATPAAQEAAQVVPTLNAYCRKGPASGYDAITFLTKGSAYNLTGRDSQNSWWRILAPGNVTCWVAGTSVTTQGAVEQVAIVSAPPLPGTPAQFMNSFLCKVTLKTLTVTLNWEAAADVTGYRIFRNGTKLVEVPAAATSYSDNPPLNVKLVYELEAFNDFGVAERTSTTVQACK